MNQKPKTCLPTMLSAILFVALACGQSAPGLAAQGCTPAASGIRPQAETRPFRMGFTRWPPDATLEAIDEMDAFIAQHTDLTALHFDGGVPWPEALADGEYPSGVLDEWRGARAALAQGRPLYVVITPLNGDRSNLAGYWGKGPNMPLPAPWDEYPLDHPDVIAAYLNYARRVVDYFSPDYLAIGLEANVAQANTPATWEAYKKLHIHVYQNLKAEYPGLPIFATFTLSHLSGLDGGDADAQHREIASLMDYNDLVGISAYPYGWMYEQGRADPIPEDFFDPALAFGKPVAITESGAPSRDFYAFGKQYRFDEAYQTRFIDLLLRKAAEHEFVFVINWASIDFDKLLDDLPSRDARELATIWVYTGLQRSDGCPKQALSLWDAYLGLPFEPGK